MSPRFRYRYPILLLCVSLLAMALLLAGCSDSDDSPEVTESPTPTVEATSTPEPTANPVGNETVIIHTSHGDITLELFTAQMPNTVRNFLKLAGDGFYENLIFHRVSDDFMIQAGRDDIDGIRNNSPYGTIDLETHPDVKHVDGAISMARSSLPNTASAEFFICDGPQPFLDGNYAAFGVVTEGIEVVRQIAAIPHDGSLEPTPGGGVPLEIVVINRIEIVENSSAE